MKLSVSNIAWDSADDEFYYEFLADNGFHGVEIAPTRIFPSEPYENLEGARAYQKYLLSNYNLEISSIQSILYGRKENIFESSQDYGILLEYAKKAIDFASASGSSNVVFGCPRNRNIKFPGDYQKAVRFFRALGVYATSMHTTVSIEANPVIYHTNFINTTTEAIQLVKDISSEGFKVNLDLGTMIYNDEPLEILKSSMPLIHHIHISEPGLIPVTSKKIHYALKKILECNYTNYVSLEMKRQNDRDVLLKCIRTVKEIYQ